MLYITSGMCIELYRQGIIQCTQCGALVTNGMMISQNLLAKEVLIHQMFEWVTWRMEGMPWTGIVHCGQTHTHTHTVSALAAGQAMHDI